MVIKAVSLFLIAMLVLAMFGKLRMPKIGGRKSSDKTLKARKCRKCGSYILGEGPCACKRQG
ncbi:MAG: hypothetical protein K8F59_07540 [Rhodobacteraceae bacterium]|nr:hypothetical protein [Paracoccaceae bacterium]